MIFKCAGCSVVITEARMIDGGIFNMAIDTKMHPIEEGLCPCCALATVKVMHANLAAMFGQPEGATHPVWYIVNGRKA